MKIINKPDYNGYKRAFKIRKQTKITKVPLKCIINELCGLRHIMYHISIQCNIMIQNRMIGKKYFTVFKI